MASPTLTYGRKYQKGLNAVTTRGDDWLPRGAVAAIFFIDAGAILTALLLYVVAGMLGIGMGYHRLLTHRGYKTYKWVEYVSVMVRHARSRRGPDLLGCDASHPSPAFRSRRRSAHAARGHVVGACGLDPEWRRSAPRRVRPGALRARPRPRSRPRLALAVALDLERARRSRRC